MPKILGLDYGKRRTGVAIGDTDSGIAFPRTTFSFKKEATLLSEIEKICTEESIKTIVIGLPTNMQGDETPQTEATKRFIERLQTHMPRATIETFDERLSTIQAERALIDKGLKKFSEIDEIAAQIILQAWIDRKNNEK
ncbi:hypothetical protein AUK45_03955 [Candidatus Peregrinibacteria bacterium CG2_30_44_17]|nr:MAG: hypothetical protein AUK45_03955 [Candidatus Peregrinibacteria bacterium CG2_30_44_17]